jgi:hypothetical protein
VSAQAQKLFISYRREETAGHAGRLYDAMAAQFGDANVFMDVDLEPGIDFVERITQAVGSCHVLLVVMGPRWATLQGDSGRARIAEPDDFVRLEVETALRRSDVTVIPLLVAGARMPEPAELPEALRPITRRNALELSDLRWRYDIGRLGATLSARLGAPAEVPVPETVPAPEPRTRTRSVAEPLIEGVIVAAAVGLVAGLLGGLIDPADSDEKAALISTTVLQRAVTWAPVGAAIAVWLTIFRGEPRAAIGRALAGLFVGALAGALGGAIYGAAVYLPDDVSRETAKQIQLGAVAAIGAVIGALLGRLWIPPRGFAGFLAGAAGGAFAQQIVSTGGGEIDGALKVGFRCVVIVGFVIATQLALDALRTGAARTSTGVRPTA